MITRGALLRLAALVALILAAGAGLYAMMIPMPGKSYDGPLPTGQPEHRTTAQRLERDVIMLAETIGERNVFNPARLHEAEQWLHARLGELGYDVHRQEYTVTLPAYRVRNVPGANMIAERRGSERPDEIIIIGAHYDSVMGSPGANDNASGVAAVLELARRMADAQPRRTLRFVCFVNEEPPMFQTDQMGSLVYARAARQRGENITAMISLETIGYYSDEEGSQQYPPPVGWFYPSRGDFIGFVSNVRSRRLLREVVGEFRAEANIPSEGGALFGGITGVGWSDHWSFWQMGYPALMVTDTALFRYPHYHLSTDTPEKLDYLRLALVVDGMEQVVRRLAEAEE